MLRLRAERTAVNKLSISGRGYSDNPLDVLEIKYYECTVRDVKQVTHDTKLFLVEFPPLTYVSVPVGHHVYLRHWVQGKISLNCIIIKLNNY